MLVRKASGSQGGEHTEVVRLAQYGPEKSNEARAGRGRGSRGGDRPSRVEEGATRLWRYREKERKRCPGCLGQISREDRA